MLTWLASVFCPPKIFIYPPGTMLPATAPPNSVQVQGLGLKATFLPLPASASYSLADAVAALPAPSASANRVQVYRPGMKHEFDFPGRPTPSMAAFTLRPGDAIIFAGGGWSIP
ncbi:hypothetical protein AYO49_04765 [Verrucomicrobiaceae bacterium SCGC AG-212-N21]|nr:hypothetical protein AYO49_04765 [Verrucomicrobiaceae bacterium SCGC AG-212-N21]